jgi:hypothetical protein
MAASAAATSAGMGCRVGAVALLVDEGVELADGGVEPVDDEEDDEEPWAKAGVKWRTRAANRAKRAKRNTNSLKDQFIGRSPTGTAEFWTRRWAGANRARIAGASKSEQTGTRKRVKVTQRGGLCPSNLKTRRP